MYRYHVPFFNDYEREKLKPAGRRHNRWPHIMPFVHRFDIAERMFLREAFRAAIIESSWPTTKMKAIARHMMPSYEQWIRVRRQIEEDIGDPEIANHCTAPWMSIRIHPADFGYISPAPRGCGRCVRAVSDIPRHVVLGVYPGYAYTLSAYKKHMKYVDSTQQHVRNLYAYSLRVRTDAGMRDVVYDFTEDNTAIVLDADGSRVPTFDIPFEYLLYLNESTTVPPNVVMVTSPDAHVYAITTREIRANEELCIYYGEDYPRDYVAVATDPEENSAVAQLCAAVGVDSLTDRMAETLNTHTHAGFGEVLRESRERYKYLYI